MPGVGQSQASVRSANKQRAKQTRPRPPAPLPRSHPLLRAAARPAPRAPVPTGHHKGVRPTVAPPRVKTKDLLRITTWKSPAHRGTPLGHDPKLPSNYFDDRLYGRTLHGRAPLPRYQNFKVNPQLAPEKVPMGPLGRTYRRRKNPALRFT